MIDAPSVLTKPLLRQRSGGQERGCSSYIAVATAIQTVLWVADFLADLIRLGIPSTGKRFNHSVPGASSGREEER